MWFVATFISPSLTQHSVASTCHLPSHCTFYRDPLICSNLLLDLSHVPCKGAAIKCLRTRPTGSYWTSSLEVLPFVHLLSKMSNEPSTTPPPELDHSSLLDQSSPLKNVQHISGREQLEVSSTVREAPVHENFVQDHLSKLPDGLAWRNHVDKELLAKATERQPQGGEVTYYDPFARFLTKLSQHIYGKNFDFALTHPTNSLLSPSTQVSWTRNRRKTSSPSYFCLMVP